MGPRMSETPSCATTEPSTYSTIECTIDSGWTTMSMRLGSTSKSQRASITSRPLFMRVAESMVILSPIDQFGCLSARAGVTSASSRAPTVRSGPPDAVSRSLRTCARSCPASDWKMALCSLSTGRMVTPRAAARAMSSSPANTIDSLLARPTAFPASIAAAVERRPAPPAMAARTRSTSGSAAAAVTPSSPSRISGASRPRSSRSLRAAERSDMATTRGRKRRTCSAARSAFLPAASAVTSKRPGARATTSSACTPIEPVEPRMASCFMRGTLPPEGGPQIDPRRDEEQRVDAVEQPAVPRDELARVLHARGALQHRLGEVAERAEHRRAQAEPDAAPPGELERLPGGLRDDQEHGLVEEGPDDAPHDAAREALPGLLG